MKHMKMSVAYKSKVCLKLNFHSSLICIFKLSIKCEQLGCISSSQVE